jgi:hypothetical protein
MATVGLKGVWGLEQLDRTGVATWKLGLILMGAAAPVGYVLAKLLSGMAPNPVLETMSPQGITAVTCLCIRCLSNRVGNGPLHLMCRSSSCLAYYHTSLG